MQDGQTRFTNADYLKTADDLRSNKLSGELIMSPLPRLFITSSR